MDERTQALIIFCYDYYPEVYDNFTSEQGEQTTLDLLAGNEANKLRKKIEELESELAHLRKAKKVDIPNLAPLDDEIEVFGTYRFSERKKGKWSLKVSWREIFATLSPYLLDHPNDVKVSVTLGDKLFERTDLRGSTVRLDDQLYQTIKIQLQALDLVKVEFLPTTTGKMALFWSLTDLGYSLMMQLRAIRGPDY